MYGLLIKKTEAHEDKIYRTLIIKNQNIPFENQCLHQQNSFLSLFYVGYLQDLQSSHAISLLHMHLIKYTNFSFAINASSLNTKERSSNSKIALLVSMLNIHKLIDI